MPSVAKKTKIEMHFVAERITQTEIATSQRETQELEVNSLIILSKVRIIVARFCMGGTRVCSGNMCATHVLAKETSNSCLVKALTIAEEMITVTNRK